MIEGGKVVALGSAYVEGKIQSSELCLPKQRDQLPVFLDAHTEATLYAGGSIPNILTSYLRLSGNPTVKLLSCVGNDPRGQFYIENMDRRLGKPQVTQTNPTDIWVGIYNNGLVEGMDLYGAITNLSVSRDERTNAVFITDIDACKLPETTSQIKQVLEATEDEGLFVLSLVGSIPEDTVQQVLSFTDRDPDLVFGNAKELLSISRETDIDKAIKTAFPSSKLLVVTQAERGAKVRFDGEVFVISPKTIPQEQVIDETGAGDSYMGTMLALLLPHQYKDWRETHIREAANIASYASTLVITTMQSKLTEDTASLVREYAKRQL